MQILFFRGEAHIIYAATASPFREEDSELSFKGKDHEHSKKRGIQETV